MRTSRISRDTAKLFERAANSPSPPRRITRSSFAKFAFTTNTATNKQETPDIEDAIGPPPPKKRRKAATSASDAIKTELQDNEDDKAAILNATAPPSSSTTTAAPRRARKPARKVADPSTGETTVSPPSDWEEIYNAVRKMRAPGGAAHGAAVDTMGCERLADRTASPRDQRFHTLIALMLSSQTKDTVNAVVMKRLQTQLPAHKPGAPMGLNLENILAVDPKLLNEMIWQVGFHNNKTKYIKQAAEILRDNYNSDIPDSIPGLTSLPGVGPKMAYLCLSVAWHRTEGIGVDVHVHRITNLWGWNKTKNPEETRLALQSWLPQDRWHEINSLLVGLGQSVCLPVGRRCGECDLGLGGLCKAAERKKVIEGRRVKEEEEAAIMAGGGGGGGGDVVKTEVKTEVVVVVERGKDVKTETVVKTEQEEDEEDKKLIFKKEETEED